MSTIKRTKEPLSETHPNLVKDWDYDKNAPLTPAEVSAGSQKKCWWKCSEGHEWQATVKNRTSGTNCPICSLSLSAKSRNANFIIQRGSLVSKYPELVNEWDWDKNINISPDKVLPKSNKMFWWKCKKGHEWTATPAVRTKGNGCPYCSGRRVILGENDLETTHPNIAKEWHPTKNGNLNPRDFSYGSHKRIWWQCYKGHEWQTPIAYRTIDKTGCPYCAKELQTSFPEQAILFYMKKCFPDVINNPFLINEWDFENNNIIPDTISSGSHIKVWWKCSKGHKWQASVRSRACGAKCPFCSGRSIIIGENDLKTTHPDLAQEWNSMKNGDLSPQDVTRDSNRKVWWICNHGHEWQAVIASRVSGRGCPICGAKKSVAAKYKPVICIETNAIYSSITEAESITGINRSSISDCCKGKYKTAGGYRWKFINE